MNLFYEEYPKTLEICGEPIPIVTDFREYIKLLDMIKDEEVSDEEKAFLLSEYFLLEVGDFEEAILKLSNFVAMCEVNEGGNSKGNAKPLFSFRADYPYIMAGFLRDYGIDLSEIEYLHWWKFRMLFEGLSEDTEIKQRIMYRGINLEEIKDKDYTHRGNPEFHFADFDFATGIGTTTEPHGLTKKTEVLICPNDWTILNPFNGMLSMPIEWTMVEKLSDALALIPVDNTHLKVVASKEEAIINVNLEDVSNTNVDITKFHFEKPISYVVKNLDNKINTKYIKVLSSGYCFWTGKYRYRNVSVIFESGKTGIVNYINTLGFSRGGNTPARNGIFVNEETLIDLRNNTKYYNKILSYARRKGYSHLVNDPARAVDDAWISSQGANVKAIKSYSTYSDSYAYMSNGTRIQIYALEGEYKNES